MTAEMLDYIRTASMEDLESVCGALASRITDYRKAHEGKVPPRIFPHTLTLGGAYSCVELVVRSYSGDKYALKLRDDPGWTGLYHIPGTVVRFGDDMKSVFARLSEELWGEDGRQGLAELLASGKVKSVPTFPCEIHAEDEYGRHVAVMSALYVLDAPPSALRDFAGTWKWFTISSLDSQVIDHHRSTLKRIHAELQG